MSNIDDTDPLDDFYYSQPKKQDDNTALVVQKPLDPEEIINPITNPQLEIIECIKCGHANVLKKTPKRRRQTRVRHFRIDDVTYASLKRFASINGLDLNYAIYLLLLHAKTQNIDYIVNENAVVTPRHRGRKKKSKKNDKK